MGSTARATPKSPVTIRSDWRPADTLPTAPLVAPAFIPRSCWICPSRSVDWRDQLDRKNPVTMRSRVCVSAWVETDVLTRVPKMLVAENIANARNATMIALVGVTE